MRLFILCALLAAALAGHALAQGAVMGHGAGRMALSPDGTMVAFHDLDTPQNSVLVHDFRSDVTYRIQAPEDRGWLTRPNWSADGDTLVLLAADGRYDYQNGTEVWAIDFSGGALISELLFEREDQIVAATVSSDDERLLYAGSVYLPGERTFFNRGDAYGVFERQLGTGETIKRSDSQFEIVYNIAYGAADEIYLSAYALKFQGRISADLDPEEPWTWSNRHPDGRSITEWEIENDKLKTFRIALGETLPDWPTPYPAKGEVPYGTTFQNVATDGRLILSGNYDPNNDSIRQQLRWYGSAESREKYAIKERPVIILYDGTTPVEVRPFFDAIPEGSTSGGSHISADLKYHAKVYQPEEKKRRRKAQRGPSTLVLTTEDGIVFSRTVAELREKETVVVLGAE